ncbi:MAG: C45 family autoproteolytic acyltransferase/hydrolase [Planctomycetes bacterium]|nr:C45 family autoproteolytic acyltransferase/hydrolase [Planctomycetota bacterium]
MTRPDLTVDLAAPPAQRWRLDAGRRQRARELLAIYERDLGLQPAMVEHLVAAAPLLLSADLLAEHAALASHLEVPLPRLLLATCYYDCIKAVLGCSAFAVERGGRVLHARNLDWWSEGHLLADSSCVVRYVGAPAGEFTAVGWPGYLGVLSGVAKGRFAVTLNAVTSDEPAQLATPVVVLLREVLATAPDFATAVERLASTTIPCDCLLLVTGTAPGERVVIERTPCRSAARFAPHPDQPLIVTNDYRALTARRADDSSPIAATSCGRFDALQRALAQHRPTDAAQCLQRLDAADVRMAITMQQMVFEAATGDCRLRVPPRPAA